MRNGFRIVDIDTHVNPSYDTLVKYLDPSTRARAEGSSYLTNVS